MGIIAKQTKVKHLMSLKEGKYTKLCKTEPALKAEIDKQENRYHHTINILDRVGQEFPHSRQGLRRVATTFTRPLTLRLKTIIKYIFVLILYVIFSLIKIKFCEFQSFIK